MDPLSAMFGEGAPFAESGSSPGSSGNNLQLAPIYNSQRHNVGGDTQFPREGNNFLGDYEEEQESFSKVDSSGIHVGVRMSRTHQTPFGPARANVGMQMSIGENGLTMTSRSSSSIGFGGGGGRMLMLSFGGCPHHGQRSYDPMNSLFSPFGGLFSPHSGFFSSMSNDPTLFGLEGQGTTGSQNYGDNYRLDGDGPIIEEIFDEEESGYSGSKNESSQSIEYKKEEIDASLGLGLLPEEEAVGNSDRNKDKESEDNGILNDFAFSEETPGTNDSRHFVNATKCESKGKRKKNKNRLRAKSQKSDAKYGVERILEKAETKLDTISFEVQPFQPGKSSKNNKDRTDSLFSENLNGEATCESKVGRKFAKQEFRKVPLRLDDGLQSLPFLRSPPVEENVPENSPLKRFIDSSSVHKQSKKKVNKNSFVRLRCNSSDSTSSRLDSQDIDNESTKSYDITTDILDIQSFPYKHVEDVSTAASLTEISTTSEENSMNEYTPRTSDAMSESPISPIENSDSTGKIFDESMHGSFDTSVDYTQGALSETAENNVSGTDDISGIDTNYTQNGLNREATGDGCVDILAYNTPSDRCSPVSFEIIDNNKGYSMENACLKEDFLSSLEMDTLKEENGTCRTEPDQPCVHEHEKCNPDIDVTSPGKGNIDVDSKSNSNGISIEDSISERNRPFETSPSHFEGTASAILIFFNTKAERYDSNKKITNFMPSKDRKKEAGQMFQVHHFEEGQPQDVLKISPDFMSQQNEPTDVREAFVEGTTKLEDDTFEKMPDLQQRSEDERASPELELFHFDSQNSLEMDSLVDFKQDGNNQGQTSQRKSNITPLRKSKSYDDDNGGDDHLSNQQNEFDKSLEHKGHASNVQWEYPGLRSAVNQPLHHSAEQSNDMINCRKDFPFDVENEHQRNQNRIGPHNIDSLNGGGYQRYDSSSNKERDLSSTGSLQNTHSYHGGYNDDRQNMHSYYGGGAPHSGCNNYPTPQNTSANRKDGNQYSEEYKYSEKELMQSHSPSSHGKDTVQTYDHMCPHMILQAQCKHKVIDMEFHDCCQNYHYFCRNCFKPMSLKEYNEQKRVSDNDDIFQHPDWQHLNEYRDETGQFSEPKSNPKTKLNKNKNITVKASTPSASATQDANFPTSVRETRTEFSDLIESVGLIMKDVYPDGNCLFTSVCDQLRVRGDFSYTPRDLRHSAVDFLRENPNQDDGTPLLDFLADEERNWEKYLSSMRRDGHWGDHFVIWALAHVLNRRIIIYRGDKELHTIIVEPSASVKNSPSNEDVDDNTSEGKSEVADKVEDTIAKQEKMEEMYLGHISESHYVSLRPVKWRDELFEELKKRKTSSLVGLHPDSKALDSNGDVFVRREVNSLSSRDLNFFLNYLRRGQIVFKIPIPQQLPKFMKSPICTQNLISDFALGFEYKLWANIKTKSDTKNLFDSFILTTPSDTSVARDRRHVNMKDLIIHDDDQFLGKFKLIPAQPDLWKPNLVYKHNVPFLKQLECKGDSYAKVSYKIGFKSESWPEGAMEWKSRKRLFDWPSQSTIDEILETGACVVPAESSIGRVSGTHDTVNKKVDESVRQHNNAANQTSRPTDKRSDLSEENALMWEFDFAISEIILCKREIRQAPRTLYCILEAVSQFAFAEKSLITSRHLKTLLYFTCENHSNDDIRHQPGKCLLYELSLLREFLQRKHFPHYFMRGRNLIANMGYEDIAWHIERLELVLSNLLAVLYCMLDYCTLKNVYDLGTVFDSLCRVVFSGNEENTKSDEYPVDLCVTSLASNIKSLMFIRARTMIDSWYSELVYYFGKHVFSKEEFVSKVLSKLPLQEQWLFAFYMDCTDGSNYLKFVCRGLSCVQFENLFGSNVTSILLEETSLSYDQIHLPTPILGESMIYFARRLGDILYDKIACEDAYYSAIHHFLKTNTHDLLLGIESDQRANRDNYTQMKLSNLAIMFEDLYNSYHHDKSEYMYRDLMEAYDKLCNFLATEHDFTLLSELWDFFGESHRAREAYMKAESVRNESRVVSTSL